MLKTDKKYLICPKEGCHLYPELKLNKDSEIELNCKQHGTQKIINIEECKSDKIFEENFYCQNHKGEKYLYHCKKCGKDMCEICVNEDNKEHYKDDIIDFPKIHPTKHDIQNYNNDLKKMIEYKDKINKLEQKMKNIKSKINELNNLVNKFYDHLYSFKSKFDTQYQFNSLILEQFDINIMNLNAILNINQYKENKEKPSILDSDEESSIYNLIEDLYNGISDGIRENNRYVNTCIIPNIDIKETSFHEAFKEFISIQYDKLGNENNDIIIENFGEEIEITNNNENHKRKLNYSFKTKDNKQLCEIVYDDKKLELTISIINNNNLSLKNLLYMIGKGFHLQGLTHLIVPAALSNKKISLIINGEKIILIRRESKFFGTECIFLIKDKEEIKEKKPNNIIQIIFSDISPNEWENEIYNYLWLNENEDIKKIDINFQYKNASLKGAILLHKQFKNKIFYKKINEYYGKEEICFGYEIEGLNKEEKNDVELAFLMISHALENNLGYYLYEEKMNVFIDNFIEYLINNDDNRFENYNFKTKVENNLLNVIRNSLTSKNKSYKSNYLVEKKNLKHIDDFMNAHKIPKKFYPYIPVNSALFHILVANKHYKTIEEKYFEELEKISLNQNIPEEIEDILIEMNLTYQIKFVDFMYENTEESYFYYPKRKCFYFSTKLFDKKNIKQFILQKVSEQKNKV